MAASRRPFSCPRVTAQVSNVSLGLLDMVWVHPKYLPDMAIEVVKAPAVHEPMVLNFSGFGCARLESCVDKVVDLRPAFERQCGQYFGDPGRVRNLLLRKRLEFCMSEQHRVDIVRNYHAGCSMICELRVELEAKLLEERHRALQVLHREIYEDFPGHDVFPSIDSTLRLRW